MKLQQKNLDQTGVTILLLKEDGKEVEKQIPLYSLKPIEEAQRLVELYYPNCIEIKATYNSNNLLKCPIENIIEDYRKEHLDLPEAYMEELVSGFPYIIGNNNNIISCYA